MLFTLFFRFRFFLYFCCKVFVWDTGGSLNSKIKEEGDRAENVIFSNGYSIFSFLPLKKDMKGRREKGNAETHSVSTSNGGNPEGNITVIREGKEQEGKGMQKPCEGRSGKKRSGQTPY